jgi:hypothetical protein
VAEQGLANLLSNDDDDGGELSQPNGMKIRIGAERLFTAEPLSPQPLRGLIDKPATPELSLSFVFGGEQQSQLS